MIQTECPHCGSPVKVSNQAQEAICPNCHAHFQPPDPAPQLRRQIAELEEELARVQAKKNIFARAKVGALQAKIQALKLQIGPAAAGGSGGAGGEDRRGRDEDRRRRRGEDE